MSAVQKKSVKKGNRVAILNYNGSISWCDDSSKEILADWYLTNDEQWYESDERSDDEQWHEPDGWPDDEQWHESDGRSDDE